MAITAGEKIHLDAFCPICEASYYRTVRPLVVGRDKLTPDLFVPIKAGTPPPNAEKPLCPTCEAPLKFIAAAGSASGPDPVAAADDAPVEEPAPRRRSPVAQLVRAPAVNREAGGSSPPRGASGVDVLFAVEPDEQVVDMKDAGGAYIVVTSKRIVRVSYE